MLPWGHLSMKKYNLSLPLALKISAELEAFYLWPFIYFYKKEYTLPHFRALRFYERQFLCRGRNAGPHQHSRAGPQACPSPTSVPKPSCLPL